MRPIPLKSVLELKSRHFYDDMYTVKRKYRMSSITTMIAPQAEKIDKKDKTTCTNCKMSHVSCDGKRPCSRCVRIGKAATCADAEIKKRGRPTKAEKLLKNQISMMQEMQMQAFQQHIHNYQRMYYLPGTGPVPHSGMPPAVPNGTLAMMPPAPPQGPPPPPAAPTPQ